MKVRTPENHTTFTLRRDDVIKYFEIENGNYDHDCRHRYNFWYHVENIFLLEISLYTILDPKIILGVSSVTPLYHIYEPTININSLTIT